MSVTGNPAQKGQYAMVNGLNMYYEIYGSGNPLVLIHGGGSTIGITFGNIIPYLEKNHKLIAVELQAHGHTADRGTPTSFEQDADDVAELIRFLDIMNVDVFGFSNGANTAIQLAIRHPKLVKNLVVASAFYKREGIPQGFWDFMNNATHHNMPQPLTDAFLAIENNTEDGLKIMHDRDADRMRNFTDWSDDHISSIKARTLFITADKDIMYVEHTLQMSRLVENAQLVVLPGIHGQYLGEALVETPGSKLPYITALLTTEFLNPPA